MLRVGRIIESTTVNQRIPRRGELGTSTVVNRSDRSAGFLAMKLIARDKIQGSSAAISRSIQREKQHRSVHSVNVTLCFTQGI